MQLMSDREFKESLWFGTGLAIFGFGVSVFIEAKTGLVGSFLVTGSIGALIGMVEGFLLARKSSS